MRTQIFLSVISDSAAAQLRHNQWRYSDFEDARSPRNCSVFCPVHERGKLDCLLRALDSVTDGYNT